MPQGTARTAAGDVLLDLRVPAEPGRIQELIEQEWLLTNSRGSYAAGTVIGCNTRRYHGMLVASLHPPVHRLVTLSNLLEVVEISGQRYDLATFEFSDRLHPQGFQHLEEFRRDTGVHFRYRIDGFTVEKSLYLARDRDLVLVTYDFAGEVPDDLTFRLTPLVALRDFHHMQSSAAGLQLDEGEGVVTVSYLDPHGPAVHLYCPDAPFDRGADWWYAMRYRWETRRGLDDYEDVWAPGSWTAAVAGPGRVSLIVQATEALERPGPLRLDPEDLVGPLRQRNRELVAQADARDEVERALVLAADQFVVRREMPSGETSATILAGFPWFADWGRDAFIALPGLLLTTGRFDEAREVFATFIDAMDQGMMPNCFPDYGGKPYYNSVDSALWFIQAAKLYLDQSKDKKTWDRLLWPAIEKILTAYHDGTRHGIRADADGLLLAGDPETQLTWMDARCAGVTFTPRYGKAVEINALWLNALDIAAKHAGDKGVRAHYAGLRDRAAASFPGVFWNERDNCLYDCVFPDGTGDAAIRPNQVFAVSLPFCPLSPEQQRGVVAVVTEQLLTPKGLRSLSPRDSRYRPWYEGDQFGRDSAYHQGTVWSWLIGGYCRAYLRVHGPAPEALDHVARTIEPLIEHLFREGCLASVSEIFDGNEPHYPKGAFAQAWSVAELLRVKKLLPAS